MKRKIIEINRNKCNGCGLCTTACAEGALVLDEQKKAVLVKEIYCDGLGACLNVCKTGALQIIEKDCDDYNPTETYEHVKKNRGEQAAKHVHDIKNTKPECGCPSSMAKEISKSSSISSQSELSQWPIQLHLISPHAPYFNNCDLLIAADCTAFSMGTFHQDLLKNKKLIIACPKLDDISDYVDKLSDLIKNNTIYSLTVAIMTVPCCSGLMHIIEKAVKNSNKNIAIRKIVIGLEEEI